MKILIMINELWSNKCFSLILRFCAMLRSSHDHGYFRGVETSYKIKTMRLLIKFDKNSFI